MESFPFSLKISLATMLLRMMISSSVYYATLGMCAICIVSSAIIMGMNPI